MIRSIRLLHSLSILVLLAPAAASAEGIQIESREYKLMLDPGKFADDQAAAVERFWNDKGGLKQVIDQHLDRKDGVPRSKGSFELDKERNILFREIKLASTKDCALDRIGYAFRERVDVEDGKVKEKTREATLKFRTPDLILAADAEAKAGKKSAKLEEDISPLIARAARANGEDVIVAQPRSMRSLFSVSTKLEGVGSFNALGEVLDAYPTWHANLKPAGLTELPRNTSLLAGPVIHERVFDGAKVDLGLNKDVKFALTLWSSQGTAGSAKLITAEISFKYDTKDGGVDDDVARRALRLFQAMQEHLGDWSNPERATKTSLALPEACQ